MAIERLILPSVPGAGGLPHKTQVFVESGGILIPYIGDASNNPVQLAAKVAGDPDQAFSVGVGNEDHHALQKEQIDTALADKAPLSAINNDEDFYEQGTFSGVIIAASAGAQDITSAYFFYTKIGDDVTIYFRFSFDGDPDAGNLRMEGIPFAATSASNAFICAPVEVTNVNIDAFLSSRPDLTTRLEFRVRGGGGTGALNGNQFSNGSQIRGIFKYRKQ